MNGNLVRLVWNHHARVGVFPNHGEPRRFVVCAPSKRRGLVKHVIDQASAEWWAAMKSAFSTSPLPDGKRVDSTSAHAAVLEELGLFLREEEIPESRPAFACWLDQVRAADASEVPRYLEVATDMYCEWDEPNESAVLLERTFEWGGPEDWFVPLPRIWVTRALTGARFTYGLRGTDRGQVRRLLAARDTSHLSMEERERFWRAGILVDRRRPDERQVVAHARNAVEREGYALVGDIIPEAQRSAMAQYVQELVSSGFVKLGDAQVTRRYAAHNEGLSRYLHHQLTAFASHVFGLKLKPSYCYLVTYLHGAVLKRHIDREQSAYSLNVLLDAWPLRDGRSQWPFHIESAPGPTPDTIHQALGEAVLYEGANLYHHRPALPEGSRSASLFLQYVPVSYSGSLL